MDLASSLKLILQAKASEPSDGDLSWPLLCQLLLAEEPKTTVPHDETTIHLHKCISNCLAEKAQKPSQFEKGCLQRPFYLALAEMLQKSIENYGQFPVEIKASKVFMLEIKNLQRLEEIENELKKLRSFLTNTSYPLCNLDQKKLSRFLFEFLTPNDLNTFLGLRTTVGSSPRLPPSLSECIKSFTRVYVKNSAKDPSKSTKTNTLTVGAKAFSKHCHRDISASFWGKCTGTEKQKNEQANYLLANILTNAAWINLHSLPHDTRVYEIRNEQGYGARWEIYEPKIQDIGSASTAQGETNKDAIIIFRGFLEPQMEDGHSKGWVH
ncbi:hypothetical protein G9A89_011635 [Geosiphon pyriformis]|nr:hypothetical protein G9A89_011635 [Geosiphon pyriformis]